MAHDEAPWRSFARLQLASSTTIASCLARLDTLTSIVDAERDRWIIWIVIAFGSGSAFYFGLHDEPSIVLGPLVMAAIVSAAFAFPRHTLITASLGLALSAAAGFTAAKIKTEWVRAPVIIGHDKAANVTGDIELIEPRDNGGKRFTIRPVAIDHVPTEKLPTRIRVTVSKRSLGRTVNFHTGDRITFRARLNPPAGPVMPGGYDFARYAWFKQLGAVGYAISPPKKVAVPETSRKISKLTKWIAITRATIGHRVKTALPTETGAIANALITGERGAITDATNEAYRDAGLYHVLSISGLHMAIMAGAVFFALRTLLAFFPFVALTQPIKKWAAVGAIIGAFAYLLISGGAFATIRSFFMILIMFIAILLDRPALALRNVAMAALIILALFPESILDAGFQMSFAAVSALVAGFELVTRTQSLGDGADNSKIYRWVMLPLMAIVLSTVIASAAVAPFAIYHFNNAQHFAVLANIVAMPACNLIVMPAALAALVAIPFGLEYVPLAVMGFGIDLMTWTANKVAALPGSVSHPAAMPATSFALIVAGGLVVLVVRHLFRFFGVALIAVGIALAPFNTLPDILVGRDGDVIAIKTKRGTLAAHTKSQHVPKRAAKVATRAKPPYELTRWMERYGDTRPPDAALNSKVFKCDRIGCTARKTGIQIAIPRHLAAHKVDCARADIVVFSRRAPRTCAGPDVIVDKPALRKLGPHAIYLHKNGDIGVVTTISFRGKRPWVAGH